MRKSRRVGQSQNRRTPTWLRRAVGIPFLLLGCLALAAMVREWILVAITDDWIPTQATVVSVELPTRVTSKGAKSYRIVSRYTYTARGRTYEGTAVREADWPRGFDSGSYHQEWFATLTTAMQSGQSIQAWYHPDEPHRSVLARSIRPVTQLFYLALIVTLGGLGGWLVFAPESAMRGSRQAPNAPSTPTTPARPRVRIEETAGAVAIHVSQLASGALLLGLGGLIFLTSSYFSRRVMAEMFAVLGLALIAIAIWLWNRIVTCEITNESITVKRRIGTRVIPLSTVAHVEVKQQWQVGDQTGLAIFAHTVDGRKIRFLEGLDDGALTRTKKALARFRLAIK
jgi:hypothetical protein